MHLLFLFLLTRTGTTLVALGALITFFAYSQAELSIILEGKVCKY